MSWSKFDDLFTDRTVFETIDFQSRWHYIALVLKCSAEDRFDGVMPLSRARRASDVDDPDKAHAVLEEHALVEIAGGFLRVVEVIDHIAPPHIRKNAADSKVRVRRHRAHKVGDHSLCLPENCPHAPAVTGDVTRNTGTGRDGTGQGFDRPPANDRRTRATHTAGGRS